MQSFLQELAHTLYARHGEQLSEYEVLFPSRRARLFFVEALAEVTEKPIWQPHWRTIDDLMAEISGVVCGDRLRLITELYKVYSAFHQESFDKFYFWGDMLLADFDTIDKYGVDADQLFRNIKDIKELEADISYLTPRQLQILGFWSSLGPEADLSKEKRRFLEIWSTLGTIYHRFRERLMQQGFAYNGMMQRLAAERLQEGTFRFERPRRFVVAGFNALSTSEKRLFAFLKNTCDCEFYWDYDRYYQAHEEQEAGRFIRENCLAFPETVRLTHDAMEAPKQVTAVAAVSNAVQGKQVAQILRQLASHGPLDKETAIVLTDENLLMPLLYALPEGVGKVNVTMGYPLQQTLVYTFVERLLELQAHSRLQREKVHFYHADVSGLLTHPFVVTGRETLTSELQESILANRRVTVEQSLLQRDALLEGLFRRVDTWQEFSAWLIEVLSMIAGEACPEEEQTRRDEFLTVTLDELHKLRNSLLQCDLDLSCEVYASLLRRHLQTVRIPFEGEPLEGVQVMGILETRNLDFRNVLILSMTDDNFPGNLMGQSSFIPYNLRAAYDLPTPEHHEGVYAYYFYRLIQRAERVWMLYCSRADERSTGEPSRYIRQLDYESPFTVEKVEVGVDVNLVPTTPIEVVKDASIMRRLERYLDREHPASLSPTSFDRYVACPLRFYFHSVACLRPEKEVAEELDAPMFGTILHAAAQELYGKIKGNAAPEEALWKMYDEATITQVVEHAIQKHYLLDETATKADYSGNLLLVRDIVVRYLKEGVLRYDACSPAFTVQDCEQKIAYAFPFQTRSGQTVAVKFAGIVDRIDRLADGRLRVVDYKTSAPHLDFDSLELLFTGEAKQRRSNILQTLLYCMMLHRTRHEEVVPSLYYVRGMHDVSYRPWLQDKASKSEVAAYSRYADSFERLLATHLAELYDASIPFRQCDDPDLCAFCDFKQICRR